MCDALLTPSSDVASDGDAEKFRRLEAKLAAAKQIQETIKTLRSSPNYLELAHLEAR
jgi:hypothetical protein